MDHEPTTIRRRRPRLLTCALVMAMALGGCSSPPKPPSVDGSSRRPANSPMAVELQVCRTELHNIRIVASESERFAESTAATLERLAARQQALAAMQAPLNSPPTSPPSSPGVSATSANAIFTIRFGFGSTKLALPAGNPSALVDRARAAPLVLLRGRTDGGRESPAESRIARERAEAVRDHLVRAGVDPARIRTTWQPVGDHAADNTSPSGRDLNRRVEVELYRALPVVLGAADAGLP